MKRKSVTTKTLLHIAAIAAIFLINNAPLKAQTIFPSPAISKDEQPQKITFTQEEIQFINLNPTLKIVGDPSWPPFEILKTDSVGNKTYAGINKSILDAVCRKIGIQPQYIPTKNYQESIRYIQEGTAQIIMGYTNRIPPSSQIKYTEGIYTSAIYLVSRSDRLPKKGDTICLADFSLTEQNQIKRYFPQGTVFEISEDPVKVLDKFIKGKTDFIIIGQFELSYANFVKDCKIVPLDINYYQKFGIREPYAKTLVPIFNKVLKTINWKELTTVVFEEELKFRSEHTLQDLKQKKENSILRIVLTITLVFVFFISLFLILLLKKKTRIIEYDEIAGMSTFNKFQTDARAILKNAKPREYLILSINIDNFRLINDSFGVSKGNQILTELGKHFAGEKREDELVCRYYADDFVFFMKSPDFWELEDRVFKMSKVDDHIEKLLPERYNLTFSSSVYYIDAPNADISGMIDKANQAQKLGKNSYATHRVMEYTTEMKTENDWNRELTLSMNKAIENREFEVYYQLKIRFSDDKVIGAEALIRWNNPQKGFLLPGKFIPLFENNGFIEKIDKYVLHNVCSFLDSWNKNSRSKTFGEPITVSFNLSRYNLYNSNLTPTLKKIASQYDIGPNSVEIELTEGIVFDNKKKLINIINSLKEAGFKVSVDDFGSGYSSLNILKDMPADVIKLDKEFLSSVPENTKESIIITSVIEMAKKLNITTVAEGVETKIQSDLLRKIGCDIAQGFYYAKPMQEKDFLKVLENSGIKTV